MTAYRADIDGLRAISVIAVILFHLRLGCPGGYVGVDVFFVISGYLITGLILKDEPFSLVRFWERRIKRIAPAATLTVAATLAAAIACSNCATETADAAIAQQALSSNVFSWLHTDYCENSAGNPLLHTWSLAVEEQFYLLLPLVLLLLRRFRWVVLLGALLSSFALCEWMSREYPSANFYLLPSRAWELLLGSVLSMIPCRRARPALAYFGLAMILWSMVSFNRFTRFPSIWALAPCIGAALVIYGRPRLLALRPLPEIGLISYSLYLWHWPVMVLLRGASAFVLLPLVFVLGYLSWRWVETPLRRGAWPAKQVFATAAAASLALVVAAAQFATLPGQMYQASLAYVGQSSKTQAPESEFRLPDGFVWLDSMSASGKPAAERIDFLIWGDSHAESAARTCRDLALLHGLTGVLATQPGFAPLVDCWCADPKIDGPNAQRRWGETVRQFIAKHGIRRIILIARWEDKLDGSLCDDETLVNSPEDSARVLADRLSKMVEEFGAMIWLVPQSPRLDPELDRKLLPETKLSGITRAEYDEQQAAVAALPEIAGVCVIAPGDWWRDDLSVTEHDGKRLYRDDDHVNETGAEFLMRPVLAPIFQRLAEDRKTP